MGVFKCSLIPLLLIDDENIFLNIWIYIYRAIVSWHQNCLIILLELDGGCCPLSSFISLHHCLCPPLASPLSLSTKVFLSLPSPAVNLCLFQSASLNKLFPLSSVHIRSVHQPNGIYETTLKVIYCLFLPSPSYSLYCSKLDVVNIRSLFSPCCILHCVHS